MTSTLMRRDHYRLELDFDNRRWQIIETATNAIVRHSNGEPCTYALPESAHAAQMLEQLEGDAVRREMGPHAPRETVTYRLYGRRRAR